MLFQHSSNSQSATIDNLVIPTLFVLAQAALDKQTNAISFAQLKEAVVRAMNPAPSDRAAMESALQKLLSSNRLVGDGFISYRRSANETGTTGPIINVTQRGMAILGRRCVDLMPMPDLANEITADPRAARNLEQDILVPMLAILVKLHEESGLPVSMSTWRQSAKQTLHLSTEDMGPLLNRTDTKLDQLMRNIKSHNTMRKLGWVIEITGGTIPTERGMAKLAEEFLAMLPKPDFKNLLMPAETAAVEPEAQIQEDPVSMVRPRVRVRRR